MPSRAFKAKEIDVAKDKNKTEFLQKVKITGFPKQYGSNPSLPKNNNIIKIDAVTISSPTKIFKNNVGNFSNENGHHENTNVIQLLNSGGNVGNSSKLNNNSDNTFIKKANSTSVFPNEFKDQNQNPNHPPSSFTQPFQLQIHANQTNTAYNQVNQVNQLNQVNQVSQSQGIAKNSPNKDSGSSLATDFKPPIRVKSEMQSKNFSNLQKPQQLIPRIKTEVDEINPKSHFGNF